MTGDPRIDGYQAATGREAMLRFGPDEGPVVIAAMPLFEEANRTRAFMVTILRALAARGIGSALPDLPGQGESLVPLDTVSLADMQTDFARAVDQVCAGGWRGYVVGIRSGALLDRYARTSARWHLAPQDGTSLLRELHRIRKAEAGRRTNDPPVSPPITIAGNLLSADLLNELAIDADGDAASVPRRIVRMFGDPALADAILDGPALWRRSEPGSDPVFAQMLADDIARWTARCEG